MVEGCRVSTIIQLKQSEKQFQTAVIELAERLGWKAAHFNDSRREIVNRKSGERRLVGDKDARGFPDLVLLRDDRLVFAELKSDRGRLSQAQLDWIVRLERVESIPSSCVSVFVWKPPDWPWIETVLAR